MTRTLFSQIIGDVARLEELAEWFSMSSSGSLLMGERGGLHLDSEAEVEMGTEQ